MVKIYVNLLVGIISSFIFLSHVNAFTHIVGGSKGWSTPENLTFFEDWAKPRTFGVGDKLVFPYRSGANNLVVVNKTDFNECGQDDVIFMYYKGPTTITLTEQGDHYFYCGVGKHCEAGQKLHINVNAAEGSSGSDPLPFNLEEIGIDRASLVASVSTAPAPSPTHDLHHHSASSEPSLLRFASAGILMLFSFALSLFIIINN